MATNCGFENCKADYHQLPDGTIPPGEALEALAQGKAVEWRNASKSDYTPWLPLESGCELFSLNIVPHLRFRLAPPSRLKALVEADEDVKNWTDFDKKATLRVAQSVTRDIIAFVNSPTCAGRDNEAIAGAIEHVYGVR